MNLFHIGVMLEITERQQNLIRESVLRRLKEAGAALALDDFGTGYSGLSCLNELAIDYIKIDKSFVSRVSDQKDSTILLDCVIELARKMSLNIVAEGVETKDQLSFLQKQLCVEGQGFLFGHPVLAEDFARLLVRGKNLLPC